MRFGKVRRPSGAVTVVMVDGDRVVPLNVAKDVNVRCLADLIQAPDPVGLARSLVDPALPVETTAAVRFLAPVDRQEVWAAGVTYRRSKIAREEESAGAAGFYDKVYTAPRPELFLKATPERVAGPGDPIRVRRDSRWSVPEPELALVVAPDLRIVGYTVGNDVSARDIEGENPLYLPQAKIYSGSCAVGPLVTPAREMPPLPDVEIRLVIRRDGTIAFEGATTLAMLARTPESLVEWLGRENDFPNGVILLTGTGIVPPDDFTLRPGDGVDISISGIGNLSNPVE
jgi:2-dehydro-3-deoxy-D-arabinonate dehydratase